MHSASRQMPAWVGCPVEGRLMQLYEWSVKARAAGQPGTCPVGVTDSAFRARARMLQALDRVPAGLLARGQVSRLLLGSGRLTYDRVETLARVIRDGNGALAWQQDSMAGARPRRPRTTAPAVRKLTVIDGRQLRALRDRRGLSREKLAWTAGVALTTLARLERQDSTPCLYQTVSRLAEVLGEHPETMLAASRCSPQSALSRDQDRRYDSGGHGNLAQ